MNRMTIGIVVLSGALATGYAAFAAEGGAIIDQAGKAPADSAYTDEAVKTAEVFPGREILASAQVTGTHGAAMRQVDRAGPSSSLRHSQSATPAESDTGSGSGLALLVAGLGVALLSIIRRIRGIQ